MHIFEMGTGKQQEQSAETVRQELLDKPKLSLNVPERLSNWMELFYDLAFSASLVSLANLLNAHIIFSTAVKTLLLFIPFWWIWIGHAVFTTRFATDNLLFRVVTLCQMLAVSAMTIELPQAVGKGGFVFTLGYCTARICLLILYLQIWQTIPKAKLVARFYVFGFTPGMLCWAAALFLDHYRAWLWVRASL